MKHLKLKALPALLIAASLQAQAQLPTGMTVVNGQASTTTNGKQLTVTNSANTILDWRSFSIGADSAVRFVQPSSTSSVLNRVSGNDPSNILGSLTSNGRVWLLNPNGVLFGANARVDVASLVTSTLNIANNDWLAGRNLFSGTGGSIVNQGEIRSSTGGRVALIASDVKNEGLISAPDGQVILAAGSSVELVDTGAPNLSVKLTAPTGQAVNLGSLKAGRIDVMAAAVNQQGIVEAQDILLQADGRLTLAAGSATHADGAFGGTVKLLGREIELQNTSVVSANGVNGGGTVLVGGGAQGQDASVPNADGVYFAPGASISADAITNGNGGNIVLWADVATRAYGSLSAHGGAQGGDGGLIETSGHWLDAQPTRIDVSAKAGKAGTWLLDPYNITISDSASDAGYDTLTFTANANDATINPYTISNALEQGNNVTISTGAGGGQAGNIYLTDAYLSPYLSGNATLTLNAAGDIIANNLSIYSTYGGALDVVFNAGASGQGAIKVDNSYFDLGSGSISLGGFGSGGAAVGHAGTPDGVKISGSTFYAGNVSIVGQTAVAGGRGVAFDAGSSGTYFSVDSLSVTGNSTAGTGVQIQAADVYSYGAVALSGTGSANGVEINYYGANTPLTFYGEGITLSGTSTGSGYGVRVNVAASSDALFDMGNGALQISGSNTGGQAAVSLVGSTLGYFVESGGGAALRGGSGVALAAASGGVDINATGGGLVLQDVSLSGNISDFSARSNSTLLINGGDIWANNTIGLHAQNITLAGALYLTSYADTGTGILVDGYSGGAAQSFDNQVGSGVFSFGSESATTVRWIVYLNDATNSSNLNLGGLVYDFKRYGATSSSDFAADTGNGLITAQVKYANLNGTLAPRAYDGTTTADVQNANVIPGVAGDQIVSNGGFTAAYSDKNAGTGKTVVVTPQGPSSFFDANGRPVYGYVLHSNVVGDITPALLSGIVTAQDKVYDATTAATLIVAGGFTGLIGNETVGVTGVANFADKNVGTGKQVNATYQLTDGTNGGLASNYQFTSSGGTLTASITPALLNATGVAVQDKVYDTTTVAMLTSGMIQALGTDDVTLVGGTATFSDKNVGVNKAVTLTGYSLSGADAGNYLLSAPTGLTASITPALLNLVVTAQNKVYDGSTAATLGNASATPLSGDIVSVGAGTGAFSNRNVGVGKNVILSGFDLSGTDAGNYLLALPTVTASITPATLTYIADLAVVQTGAPLPPFTGSISGFVGGETQSSATSGSLSFTSSVGTSTLPGIYAINGSGLTAANYQFVQAGGNATALSIVGGGPAAEQAQAVVQIINNVVQPEPQPPGNRSSTGILDLTPAPLAAQPGGSASFAPLPLSNMPPQTIANALGARATFMRQLLSDGLNQLAANPAAADAPPCKSLKEASTGVCLVTEALKLEARKQRLQLAAAPAPAPAAPPVPGAAPAPAPEVIAAQTVTPSPEPMLAPMFAPRRIKTAALPAIRRKIAVLIGESQYADKKIPSLENSGTDAHAVAQTLNSQLGYETLVLDNPSKQQIIATLNRLALESGEEDSVIIYYAGHGAEVDSTGQGYWLPANADASQAKTWLSNADIGRLVQQVGAHQVALISDSCYSGALVSGTKIRGASGTVNPADLLSRRAAVVMSSGGNEPVFDSGRGGHSLFAWSLMRNLEQVTEWQLGGNMFERIRFTVARELPQRPQYGAAQGTVNGGDYFFEYRQLDVL